MHFNQLLRERYSVREYKPLKVSKALLIEVLEAGRMAPSAANRQPWSFILVSDDANLEKIKECYDREWFKAAPQVIVICGNHEMAAWVYRVTMEKQVTGKPHALRELRKRLDAVMALPDSRSPSRDRFLAGS